MAFRGLIDEIVVRRFSDILSNLCQWEPLGDVLPPPDDIFSSKLTQNVVLFHSCLGVERGEGDFSAMRVIWNEYEEENKL